MMKGYITTIALLLCCVATSWGQKKYITLREAPLKQEVSGFYIAEVLDLREQRDSVGFERIRATGEQLPVKLARGLAGELYTYLKASAAGSRRTGARYFGDRSPVRSRGAAGSR